MDDLQFVFLCGAVFAVAVLYSSVGHGGASGYLAILSLISFPRDSAVLSALALNVLVSGTAFVAFRKSGHFRWDLTWPFLVSSVPSAYLGGVLRISTGSYSIILAAALCLAAFRMWRELPPGSCEQRLCKPPLGLALTVGAVIGFVSGLIGIGGGIFLSPVLLLSGWADAKETAASSSFFILANSLAGLGGHLSRASHMPELLGLPFAASAFLGGWIGSHLGAGRLSHLAIRRILSFVLWMASFKLVYSLL